jgi:glutamine amidotransferase
MVAVVDYGMGNLRSVAKAIEHVAPEAAAGHLRPGRRRCRRSRRGARPGRHARLHARAGARGLRPAVIRAATEKPFLGICIGLQMLFESSRGGRCAGLGVLPGRCRAAFRTRRMVAPDGSRLKVPHMGWNEVHQAEPHPLWEGIADDARFYFVHSYYVEAGEPSLVAAFSVYGIPFTSAVAKR